MIPSDAKTREKFLSCGERCGHENAFLIYPLDVRGSLPERKQDGESNGLFMRLHLSVKGKVQPILFL